MQYRKPFLIAICGALATAIVGCPLAGPLVVGPYRIFFNDDCDSHDDSVDALFLYPDGSLIYLADGAEKAGIWSVNGGAFSMTVYDYAGDSDLTGEADIVAEGLESGTYTVEGAVIVEGCFHARKSVFQHNT